MSTNLRATYRVQLQPGFGFDAAAALAGYLAELGVSHLYASPYLQAAPGSTHGYDVVDPNKVNRELGGAEGHARLSSALRARGLGQVLDIVPNHMAIAGRENAWWWDVLENGPASLYASYFDIDWDPPEARLRNRIVLPIIGTRYGRAVETRELWIARQGGSFSVRYHNHTLPVAPRSLDGLLTKAAERCGSDQLTFIAGAFGRLPPPTAIDHASLRRRHRDKEVLRRLLARLCEEEPNTAAAIDATVAELNADPDALDAFLEQQSFRLAHWRVAEHELDYRRFFDINTLVGLRSEDDRVFADTHRLVLGWLQEGILDGLRIDHPDGLRDPEGYLHRLREAAPGAWIVVEKVLQPNEHLPTRWPVAGTTGYDFLVRVGGLFVDPAGEGPLTKLYTEFTGETADYPAMVREKKLFALRKMLRSDLNRLAARFLEICEHHRRYRDYTRHDVRDVLQEVIASFAIYRTYVLPETGDVEEADVRQIDHAVETAKRHRPDLDPDLFDFLRDLLTLRVRGEPEADLVSRLQQLSGPVMAKGVEDTAFYCFNRLVSLNEVGGDPGRFGTSVEEFHHACREAQERWPRAMLATSTHDTKRGEDVRARIGLLSEIPAQWAEAVRRWTALNERRRRDGAPDRNMEYLFYQNLVGAWPITAERMVAFMEKAAREAKTRTSWTEPDPSYEEALRAFVQGALEDGAFVKDVGAFVAPLVQPGRVVSLAQTLIKLTAPGIPDIYQGTEFWDGSLVDPDNRRPVDYEKRRRLLATLDKLSPDEIWARVDEGLPKMWVIRQALRERREQPGLFGPESDYRPLHARGREADHVIAFSRGGGAIAVAPRLVLGLRDGWRDTVISLPAGHWRNALTGDAVDTGRVHLGDLFKRFPVALLHREGQAA